MTGTIPARTDAALHAHVVAATAANLAGWHDRHLRALGLATTWRDGWWLTPDDAPPIFFRAIAVRPGADSRVPIAACHRGGWLAACDPWSDLDLAREGMTFEADRAWMLRPAGPPPVASVPDDVTLERVTHAPALAAFEGAAAMGFGAAEQPPHTWHAPALLDDPRMDLWVARQEAAVIATANGFREAGVLGVYSVAVVPSARRRGTGTAITARTVAATPGFPAVLQPSDMAEPLYRRLGFERFTTFRTWTRSPR